ncbi:hypothetical protein HYH03_009887 [Edaphochlamys debaryana]|uniref:Uncharacterized protein n=1 Tax=Edaphochlamys debaryana TaxID=47281 RepID=A0A836BXZ8_9CHLO|nr:hypothetical protein HYH03_009887 [Edaphochlamys debaryana]|eukprot:KAG2491724.1 hypothetical protein HYH03_009887 [Edaphochlamys debaryana]
MTTPASEPPRLHRAIPGLAPFGTPLRGASAAPRRAGGSPPHSARGPPRAHPPPAAILSSAATPFRQHQMEQAARLARHRQPPPPHVRPASALGPPGYATARGAPPAPSCTAGVPGRPPPPNFRLSRWTGELMAAAHRVRSAPPRRARTASAASTAERRWRAPAVDASAWPTASAREPPPPEHRYPPAAAGFGGQQWGGPQGQGAAEWGHGPHEPQQGGWQEPGWPAGPEAVAAANGAAAGPGWAEEEEASGEGNRANGGRGGAAGGGGVSWAAQGWTVAAAYVEPSERHGEGEAEGCDHESSQPSSSGWWGESATHPGHGPGPSGPSHGPSGPSHATSVSSKAAAFRPPALSVLSSPRGGGGAAWHTHSAHSPASPGPGPGPGSGTSPAIASPFPSPGGARGRSFTASAIPRTAAFAVEAVVGPSGPAPGSPGARLGLAPDAAVAVAGSMASSRARALLLNMGTLGRGNTWGANLQEQIGSVLDDVVGPPTLGFAGGAGGGGGEGSPLAAALAAAGPPPSPAGDRVALQRRAAAEAAQRALVAGGHLGAAPNPAQLLQLAAEYGDEEVPAGVEAPGPSGGGGPGLSRLPSMAPGGLSRLPSMAPGGLARLASMAPGHRSGGGGGGSNLARSGSLAPSRQGGGPHGGLGGRSLTMARSPLSPGPGGAGAGGGSALAWGGAGSGAGDGVGASLRVRIEG